MLYRNVIGLTGLMIALTLAEETAIAVVAEQPNVIVMAQVQRSDELGRAIVEGTRLLQKGDKASLRAAIQHFDKVLQLTQAEDQKKQRALALISLGRIYEGLGEKSTALEYYSQSVPLWRTLGDQVREASTLNNMGGGYRNLKQYPQALKVLQQALAIRKKLGDSAGEGNTLENIGLVYLSQAQYPQALKVYQQALGIFRQLGDRPREGSTLQTIGLIYDNLGQYPQVLEVYQRAAALFKQLGNLRSESALLQLIGSTYVYRLKQYEKAISYYEQALAIEKQLKSKDGGAADILVELGDAYHSLTQYEKAGMYYEQSLPLFQVDNFLYGKESGKLMNARVLKKIGDIQRSLSQHRQAIEYYEQALPLYQEDKNPGSKADVLIALGKAYQSLEQYEESTRYFEQARLIRTRNKDKIEAVFFIGISQNDEPARLSREGWHLRREGSKSSLIAAIQKFEQALELSQSEEKKAQRASVLGSLGSLYKDLGERAKALTNYNQALALNRSLGNRRGEAGNLMSIAHIYSDLGDESKALIYYKQTLPLWRVVDRESEAMTLTYIGAIYNDLGDKSQALAYYNQALPIIRANGYHGEADTLNKIGRVYSDLGKKSQALTYYNQALSLWRAISNRRGESSTLNNLGRAYSDLGKKPEALIYYSQALTLNRATSNRDGEAATLDNIAFLLTPQQPDVAIVFYKQSVNVYESLRKDIRQLPRETQEIYSSSVAYTYRSLADLLIQQGRLPEAHAVLELLKLRELREFTRDAGIDSTGISLAKVEEAALNQILRQFTTVGNFTQELVKCQQTQCSSLKQLEQQRDNLYTAVNQEMRQQRAILAEHFSSEAGTLTPDKLNAEARRIVNAQSGTALIYPLVLKDKIQFLVAFQAGNGGLTFRPFETQISAEQLFKTIQTFRQQLGETNTAGRPKADLATVQATSQQLYNWLIKPLETELNNPAIKHLVFAPDATTRYIPLAALYDGKQYLIQRFTISTITAASQTDTTARMPQPDGQQSLLLAMGASTFQNLNPLPNVPTELDAITKTNRSQDQQGIYPGSEFLNTTFDYEALKESLKKGTYQILHLATHGAFKPGRVEESYLVPGRGENLTTELIDQLGNYGLGNIHLVVLSACETAVGDRASDGIEIPGISYFFLKNEVKSVMASLWNVNDASTALFMQQFYKQVAAGKTKAEALQVVQQNLIKGKLTAKDAPARAEAIVTLKPGSLSAQAQSSDFSHPYYWAPFILIGNSL